MSSALELDNLVISLIDGYTILDVACGLGKWSHLIRTCWYRTVKGRADTQPEFIIGVDVFLPSLRRVKFHNLYDEVVLCDSSHLPFRNSTFDVVLALELLEHLPKYKGRLLMDEVERISKETIVISTPNNPCFREGTMGLDGFNPYDAHISKWSIGELRSRNYRILGSSFCPKGKSVPLLKTLLSPLSYFLPSLSCYLLGIKKRSGNPSLGRILRRL